MRYLQLLILASVVCYSTVHALGRWRRRHLPRPIPRPEWRKSTGSCTYQLPCDIQANAFLSSVSFYRRFVKLEVLPPFNARRVRYFRRRHVIRNNLEIPAGTVTIPFTMRYWGFRRPKYFCRLICFSCSTSPTVPPTIPTVPPTIPTVPPTIPTVPSTQTVPPSPIPSPPIINLA